MSIGKRLKLIRGNMTQCEFAKTLSAHTNTIARYERGERIPDAEFIERVFKRFRVSPQWLLSGTGKMQPLQPINNAASSFEKLLNQYQEAGVISADSISDDEFAIIKILRFIPDSESVEIIRGLYNKHLNYSLDLDYNYIKKYRNRIATILNKGCFDKGVDLEQKIFDLKAASAELDVENYNLEIRILDLYEKSKDKQKFIKKIKKALSDAENS